MLQILWFKTRNNIQVKIFNKKKQSRPSFQRYKIIKSQNKAQQTIFMDVDFRNARPLERQQNSHALNPYSEMKPFGTRMKKGLL